MKKTSFTLIICLVLFAINGCTNENTVNPAPQLGKAIISGLATADFDLNAPGRNNVPAGTKIFVIVNTRDLVLNPVAAVNYASKTFEGTVGSDGKFSIEIDAIEKSFDITLKGNDFEGTQTPLLGTPARKIFISPAVSVTVFANGTFIRDLSYN